jgi:SET domain-containing protein
MLIIRTRVAPSEIHGLGLFTEEDLVKDQVIWEVNPLIDKTIEKQWLETLPLVAQEFVHHYAWVEGHHYLVSLDNDRFMNHSDDPNIENDHDKFCFALRDIEAGEELTCDYAKFGTAYQKIWIHRGNYGEGGEKD